MTKAEIQAAAAKIQRCLTQNFDLNDDVRNVAIFSTRSGQPIEAGVDLEAVMAAVVRGLYLAKLEAEGVDERGRIIKPATS